MTWVPAHLPAWLEPKAGVVDPYLLIAFASSFNDHRASAHSDFLCGIVVRWKPDDAASAPGKLRRIITGDRRNRLCDAHMDAHMRLATADVTIDTLELLLKEPLLRVELAQSLRAVRIAERAAPPPPTTFIDPAPSSGDLLLGIVDHGCPFAHGHLRSSPASTRIHALWDQDRHPDFGSKGALPRGFGYGSVLDNAALNRLMASAGSPVDESRCYAAASYEPMRLRALHGSHVLGLLAGAQPSPSLTHGRNGPVPPDRAGKAPVVFVQLPRDVLQAPYGPSVERALLDGIQYVLQHARARMRVVITIAYGHYLGPHDGTSCAESAMQDLVDAARARDIDLHLVFPTGNGREDRTHLAIPAMAKAESGHFAWHVPIGNAVPTHAEAWFRAPVASMKVSVGAPGHTSDEVTVTAPGVWAWPSASSPQAVLVAQDLPGGRGARMLLRVTPTVDHPLDPRSSPPGRWQFKVTTLSAIGHTIADVYAAFGHPNLGVPRRAQQSFLVADRPCAVDGKEMLIGTACGSANWLIGGYVARTMRPAVYAPSGPTRGGLRQAFNADALAISDESPALPGVIGLGNRTRVYFRMSGTSVSAPQAARELAQCGRLLPRFQIGSDDPPKARYSPGPIQGETPNVDRLLDYFR